MGYSACMANSNFNFSTSERVATRAGYRCVYTRKGVEMTAITDMNTFTARVEEFVRISSRIGSVADLRAIFQPINRAICGQERLEIAPSDFELCDRAFESYKRAYARLS